MFGTGLLGGLLAKLAGLGSVAKVALATVTAALTVTLAGGATGVLPIPGTHSGPAVSVTTTEPAGMPDATTPPTTSNGSATTADAGASATTPVGSTSVATGAVGGAEAPGVSVPPLSVPPVSVPGVSVPGVPDLSALAQVPTRVLACFSPLVDLVKNTSSMPFNQLATIGPQIVSCVTAIVADLPLPSGMSACSSNIMSFVRNVVSHVPTGASSVGGLDLAACIPSGLPVPTGLPGGLPFSGGGLPSGH